MGRHYREAPSIKPCASLEQMISRAASMDQMLLRGGSLDVMDPPGAALSRGEASPTSVMEKPSAKSLISQKPVGTASEGLVGESHAALLETMEEVKRQLGISDPVLYSAVKAANGMMGLAADGTLPQQVHKLAAALGVRMTYFFETL